MTSPANALIGSPPVTANSAAHPRSRAGGDPAAGHGARAPATALAIHDRQRGAAGVARPRHVAAIAHVERRPPPAAATSERQGSGRTAG